jgi:hypothetical protein
MQSRKENKWLEVSVRSWISWIVHRRTRNLTVPSVALIDKTSTQYQISTRSGFGFSYFEPFYFGGILMRFLSLIVLSVFVLSTATACHSTDSASRAASSSTPATSGTPKKAPATAPPADGVRRITPAEAQDLISKGQAVVIDVRNETAFNTGHVRGAKLIPYDQVASRLKEFPRDKTIITYCS